MRTLTSLAMLLTAAAASADIPGDCSFSEKRSVATSAAGIARIVIIGRSGTLHIGGHRGAPQVMAKGTACASSRGRLNETKLVLSRSGSELRVEAVMPDDDSLGSARLDFVVVIPDTIPLRIEDGPGEMTIENVGPSEVSDGAGDLTIRNVSGDLSVHDGSGDMTIENVTGNVRIIDGSGGIAVHVAGSVEIVDDTSGWVDIRNIKRDVVIGNKGSGNVKVSDVGGNFRVGHKGSGSITWERVAGRVEVPERFKR
ncbi:MAG TPA: hypothetical protein VLC46_20925 [Thermoanaerobaculia bacterium]|jgi:hypothetical protein|nr:hypothetical protein [Thermoanaerobaculia bacterium]